ncbi:MAG TPA: Gfo/Idh/MocA family oxidoreductase [Candidatus Hydrogenedentes bacterium]|nr:Gfo/Idh/MocA family oxidoreductase [Candidatus Hydrogenedentota bacterium]HPG68909.1 Gfo/Idh/MocA family oxidoreductase [Candidatus Hydrogenedentota bacterium]
MKIGIIGAENSHTKAIATVINVEKRIKGCTVDYVWGETAEFAKDAAAGGEIPSIVQDPSEMFGKVDAIICDHRHAKYHLKSVWPFVEAGIPAFVDKPFCYRAAEGKKFLEMARKNGTPVTSSSALMHYGSFKRFKSKLAGLGTLVAASSFGPADLKSQWGGIFFYGIHQVSVMLEAFGYDVKSVLVTKNGRNASAQLMYPSGLIATMSLIKEGCPGFGIGAVGAKGAVHVPLKADKSPYYNEVKAFTDMFKTGVEPLTHAKVLRPVQVLEALQKSVKSGQIEMVEQ